jgi:hypothetical protein
MNKQEFIERIESLKNIFGNKNEYVKIDFVIELISELDEPKKVVVPQFVADYIEFKKSYDFHVYGAMRVIEDHYDKRVPEWFYEKNIETFIRAWIDGYEVEKEKRYLVKLKGVVCNSRVLRHNINEDTWFMSNEKNYTDLKSYHTRKELEEAGFGEVFNSPLFEVEEVE